eukprot:m51a1_g13712 hypothetical protein (613) ;mRNA; f:92811-94649
MGQGGRFILKNHTAHRWVRRSQHAYQMDMNFPETVSPGQEVSCYTEYHETIFTHWEDDACEALYQIEGGDYTFEVAFRRPNNNPTVTVNFKALRTVVPALGPGAGFDVGGWQHDGEMPFTLMGDYAHGFVIPCGSSWMQAFSHVGWGERTLRQLCMPASHDAGMSQVGGGTAFGNAANCQTQVLPILGQLALGSRYLDIRPIIGAGAYWTGHYSFVSDLIGTQGCRGQKMDSIVDDINRFTATCKELVILRVSHDCNTDVGQPNYRSFDAAEWEGLFQILDRLNFLVKGSGAQNFCEQTLNSYIGGDKAAVLVLIDSSTPQLSPERGLYPGSRFPVYDNYANTDDFARMKADQIGKMNSCDSYFLLSWTLTQQGVGAVIGLPVLALAKIANSHIGEVLGCCSSAHYPNIFIIDRLCNESPLLMDAVFEINNFAVNSSRPRMLACVAGSTTSLEQHAMAEYGTPPVAMSAPMTLAVCSEGGPQGSASFAVNGKKIPATDSRGLNVIVFDNAGRELTHVAFNTSEDPSASDHFAALVACLARGSIVAVAVREDAARSLSEGARAACEALGSTHVRKLESGSSWALVGIKGGPALADEVSGSAVSVNVQTVPQSH